MSASDVLSVLDRIGTLGVRPWVDGGWGVDALLGEQTRPHDDLDLVLPRAHLDAVLELLATDGYAVERDLLPTAIAVRHPDGAGVDLHPIDPTADGGGDQRLADGTAFHYVAPTTGRIDGREVVCLTPAAQLATHLGYPPRPVDRADIAALRRRFPSSTGPPPPVTE